MENQLIRAVVVTVSDTRSSSDNVSGQVISDHLRSNEIEVAESIIVTDDLEPLRDQLLELSDRNDIDLIITTGGTGFGPRDNTPEASLAVIERLAPGLAEAMRRETAAKTPLAILSRGVCGIRKRTLIINLPGSPKGAIECLEVIQPVLSHAVSLIRGSKPH